MASGVSGNVHLGGTSHRWSMSLFCFAWRPCHDLPCGNASCTTHQQQKNWCTHHHFSSMLCTVCQSSASTFSNQSSTSEIFLNNSSESRNDSVGYLSDNNLRIFARWIMNWNWDFRFFQTNLFFFMFPTSSTVEASCHARCRCVLRTVTNSLNLRCSRRAHGECWESRWWVEVHRLRSPYASSQISSNAVALLGSAQRRYALHNHIEQFDARWIEVLRRCRIIHIIHEALREVLSNIGCRVCTGEICHLSWGKSSNIMLMDGIECETLPISQ